MDWHRIYVQQAEWTKQVRKYLIQKAGIPVTSTVLDLGCGTGALLPEFSRQTNIHGIDIRFDNLLEAKTNAPYADLVCGDGNYLPYKSRTFDVTFCHFVLLWIKEPEIFIAEMCRVTKSGGCVIAFAEPDYGGRIDYPDGLVVSAQSQINSLRNQGADSNMGRKLPHLFNKSSLINIDYGIIGGEWDVNSNKFDDVIETAVIEDDLAGMLPDNEIQKFILLENQARRSGERVLFIPTFFAFGVVA